MREYGAAARLRNRGMRLDADLTPTFARVPMRRTGRATPRASMHGRTGGA